MPYPLPLSLMLASVVGVTAPGLPGAPIAGQGYAGGPEGSIEGFAQPGKPCGSDTDCPEGTCLQGACCITPCPDGTCATSGVCTSAEPVAPSFLSSAATQATCGLPYRYSETGVPVVSGDSPFIFGLVPLPGGGLPEGMTVNPDTGEISWTPTRDQAGTHELVLEVWGPGGGAAQTIAITVECQVRELNVGCGCGGAGGLAPAMAAGWLLLLALARRRARGRGTAPRATSRPARSR